MFISNLMGSINEIQQNGKMDLSIGALSYFFNEAVVLTGLAFQDTFATEFSHFERAIFEVLLKTFLLTKKLF